MSLRFFMAHIDTEYLSIDFLRGYGLVVVNDEAIIDFLMVPPNFISLYLAKAFNCMLFSISYWYHLKVVVIQFKYLTDYGYDRRRTEDCG